MREKKKKKKKSLHKQSHCSPSSTYSANVKARKLPSFYRAAKSVSSCLLPSYNGPTDEFSGCQKGTRGGSFQSTRLHGEIKRDRLAPFHWPAVRQCSGLKRRKGTSKLVSARVLERHHLAARRDDQANECRGVPFHTARTQILPALCYAASASKADAGTPIAPFFNYASASQALELSRSCGFSFARARRKTECGNASAAFGLLSTDPLTRLSRRPAGPACARFDPKVSYEIMPVTE